MAVKQACAKLVKNALATPALNVSKQKIDTMYLQYFADSLVDADVQRVAGSVCGAEAGVMSCARRRGWNGQHRRCCARWARARRGCCCRSLRRKWADRTGADGAAGERGGDGAGAAAGERDWAKRCLRG